MKRIEALLEDSSALKAHLVSNLQGSSVNVVLSHFLMDPNNSFSELITFGISLAQQIVPYLSDVRGLRHCCFSRDRLLPVPSIKEAMRLRLGRVCRITSRTFLQQANVLVPLIIEPGDALKSTCC